MLGASSASWPLGHLGSLLCTSTRPSVSLHSSVRRVRRVVERRAHASYQHWQDRKHARHAPLATWRLGRLAIPSSNARLKGRLEASMHTDCIVSNKQQI